MVKQSLAARHQSSDKLTMADLMAQSFTKLKVLRRGGEVEGSIIAITDTEVTLDLGAKSEGIVSKRDFDSEQLKNLQVGEKLKVFISIPENQSGQTVVVLQKQFIQQGSRQGNLSHIRKWQKFMQALQRKSLVAMRVLEANKGGLVVESEGVRGFLPGSQVSLESMKSENGGLSQLVGQELKLSVIEVDPGNNRLIFSARKQISDGLKAKLAAFQVGEVAKGKVIAITPFGIVVDVDGVEGVVFNQEISWDENIKDQEAVDDFEAGQEIKAKVLGVDENLGRISLSIRQLQEDPFEKLAADYQIDDVVSGTIVETSANGVAVQIGNNMKGFIPASKIEPGSECTVGQAANFLVDSVDRAKRRINLAPFLTTTKGLIYK